jgi:hypothetical protein
MLGSVPACGDTSGGGGSDGSSSGATTVGDTEPTTTAGGSSTTGETSATASAGSATDPASTTSPTTTAPSTTDASGSATAGTDSDTGGEPRPYPEPGAWGPNHGPGGPAVTFDASQLYQNCAFLDGGAQDFVDHHNLLVMFDGYLMMPWSPETGTGGLTFWDITDPCNPMVRGSGYAPSMRETHSVSFHRVGDVWWAAVNHQGPAFLSNQGGIQFWDVTDTAAPRQVSHVSVPGYRYPDAYERVTLSLFWVPPYVYVAGADNGLYVIDAADPNAPRVVQQYTDFGGTFRVGQVQAVGNLLILTAAEGPRTVLLDISDPANPQPIPGGDFNIADGDGVTRESYFSNVAGGYLYFALKDGPGGFLIQDIHDPSAPVLAGALNTGGNGGYVFVADDHAFVGESSFAAIYDVSDKSAPVEVSRLNLVGDLDTVVPIGNVAVLSVDSDAERDKGSAIAPWRTEPDTAAPTVTWLWPADGAQGLAPGSRFGLTFNEFIDPKSGWEGSVRLYETGTDPALTRVDGAVVVQEVIVNFAPAAPLKPGTEYTLELPAGGITDVSGNALAAPFTATFRTAG